MNSFQKVNLYCLLLLATKYVQVIYCQRLSSTLLEGGHACPGAQVNFTCMTDGSLALAWKSDEYIGPNGAQLEFTSADGVGNMMRSSINPESDTFATLVQINGTRVVESILTITVSGSIPTANVTCSEVGQGATTITFALLAIPGIPRNVTADIIASTSDDCAVLLQWMPPSIAESSVQHYVVDSPAGSFITRDTLVEIILLIHHCNSSTYIRIHAVDYCDRDGPNTNDVLGLLLTNTTLPPVTTSTNSTDSTQSSGQPRSSTNTAAIVGGVLGGLITLGIIIALSIALGVVSNRMPVVGHLKKEELEEMLVSKRTDPESRVAPDSSSESKDSDSKDKKLNKQQLYVVVRSKHIRDIVNRPLLGDADDDGGGGDDDDDHINKSDATNQ